MKLVLGKPTEYPLMLKHRGMAVLGVILNDKELFSQRSPALRVLKEGLRDIAEKLEALEKNDHA